jgi:hypothetical protein
LEIEDLRTSLVSLYTGLRRLLEEQISRFDKSDVPRDTYAETVRFRLPENCGGKEAIILVQDLLVRLKEEWNSQLEQQPHEFTKQDMMEKEETIEQLHLTVQELVDNTEQMKQEFEETTKVYKRFENGGFFNTLYPTPNDAYKSE